MGMKSIAEANPKPRASIGMPGMFTLALPVPLPAATMVQHLFTIPRLQEGTKPGNLFSDWN